MIPDEFGVIEGGFEMLQLHIRDVRLQHEITRACNPSNHRLEDEWQAVGSAAFRLNADAIKAAPIAVEHRDIGADVFAVVAPHENDRLAGQRCANFRRVVLCLGHVPRRDPPRARFGLPVVHYLSSL
ncbi:hypothetical protein AB3X91_08910 [Paraburkholderia sp. BR14263]|uniref:hypothetical protein n=1 Tax=unclassified Paraburkholderia TaxID=2615204 RepID=UPI0034CE2123